MKRKIAYVAVCLLALVAGWMLFLRSSPPPRPQYRVMVNTMAVTNELSGARHATFRVANSGRYAVMLVPTYVLENRSGQWRTNFVPNGALTLGTNLMGVLPFHPRAKRLEAGESCTITLGLPFDDSGWRASFWYMTMYRPLTDDIRKLATRLRLTKREEIQRIVSTSWADQ
ncbi:MAG: hypothetical protein WCT12_15935 [Verrucomicrobiota bacterium]